MRVAAVDYGERRIGVAVSDEEGLLARPAGLIEDPSPRRRLAQTADLLHTLNPARILLGLPKNMDGSEGPSAAAARAFAEQLGRRLPIPIQLVDERLSTRQASRLLREGGRDARNQKGRIDAAAAVVLLQSFLDAQGPPPESPSDPSLGP